MGFWWWCVELIARARRGRREALENEREGNHW